MKNNTDNREKYIEERKITEPLLDWFADNARILPWREEVTPYRVWISEIMLQQTRVEAVKEYYRRFMEVFPDIEALASAEDEMLLKLWEGLGYYSRARNLKKAAQMVIKDYDGMLPKEKTELMKLPGIGSYTAGAIASIAYGKRAAAVDGNVLRVMMRYRGSRDDITKIAVKKELEECIEAIMPKNYTGAFTQSLMELGAIVCLPNGAPLCEECPIAGRCKARRENTWREIPVKPVKKARRTEEKTVLVMETPNGIILRKRPESGLLAGLWEFPNLEGNYVGTDIKNVLNCEFYEVKEMIDFGKAKHIFSHIEWHMQGYYVYLINREEKKSLCEGKDSSECSETETRETKRFWGLSRELLADAYEVSFEELNQKYSIPSAFEAYRKRLERKRK